MKARTTIAVAVAALIALTAVAWFAVLGPRIARVSELQAEQAQWEATSLQLQNRVNMLTSLQEDALTVAANAQRLFERMPKQAELPAVLEDIAHAATASGIAPSNITSITPSVPEPVTDQNSQQDASTLKQAKAAQIDYARMRIDIAVEGTRAQILDFVSALEQMERAFVVTSTDISTDAEGGGTLRASVSGTMFVLQSPLPDLVAGVQAAIDESANAS